MSAAEEVATEAGRLATFQEPQLLYKRRTSSTKKKTPNAVSWPHASPSPDDLAHAGFYYKPTPASIDNVSCFLCGKDIDGWESDDDPIQEHLILVPNCGWALNVAIAQRIGSDKQQEQDPMSGPLLEARMATFGDAWPHDGKRGWKCTSKKLASAGWAYNPVPEADDCVQCFYCNCSLDGWEPKDDPWEEHHRRNPDCPFFSLVEDAKNAKPTRGRKASKARSSRVSRLSTQSTLSTMSDDGGIDAINDSLAEEGDTVVTTASKSTGARKKAAPKKAKTTRKTTRAKSAAVAPRDADVPDAAGQEAAAEPAEMDVSSPPKASAKQSTRGKKQESLVLDSCVVEVEVPQDSAKPARKGRGKKVSAVHPEDAPVTVDPQPQAKAQRGKKRGTDAADASIVSVANSEAIVAAKPKAPRGKKRGSDGTEKVESSMLGPVEAMRPEIPAKSPRRAVKSTRTPSVVVAREAAGVEPAGPSITTGQAENSARPAGKGKRSKAGSFQVLDGGEASPQSSDAENQPPSARQATAMQGQRVPLAASTPPRVSPSKRNIAGGLVSSRAWQAVDVEAIFCRSPALQAMGQENIKLEHVLQSLSSPEKRMTVEEWMLHNAHVSEERLRAECERMISLFEGEGNAALQSLEGIRVA